MVVEFITGNEYFQVEIVDKQGVVKALGAGLILPEDAENSGSMMIKVASTRIINNLISGKREVALSDSMLSHKSIISWNGKIIAVTSDSDKAFQCELLGIKVA